MSDHNKIAFGAVMVILGCTIAGLFFGKMTADDSWRYEIVQRGCAEYYLDEAHYRQWRWKECRR